MSPKSAEARYNPIQGPLSEHQTSIILAILELMAVEPISKITVTRVAQAANINRKTFYNYFYSVEDAAQFIINNHASTYSTAFVDSIVKNNNLEDFYTFKKMSVTYHYLVYEKIGHTRTTNTLYERIYREIVRQIFIKMAANDISLSLKQKLSIKMMINSIMILFNDWIISDNQEMGINDLIQYFREISASTTSHLLGTPLA